MKILGKIRKRFGSGEELPSFEHAEYGKVYYPWYGRVGVLPSETPPIFNVQGERMDMYFLRDRHMANDPYGMGHLNAPTHWVWDRYNFGLKTHFYTHWEMLTTMGRPDRRYGCLIESPAIVPQDYEIFRTHRGLEKDFEAVFTYDERILNEVGNARFVPFAAAPWYGTPADGGTLDEKSFEKKTKNISMISSRKEQCELHKYRRQLALECKRLGLADTFGTFDGGPFVRSFAEILQDYRYSVMIENDCTPFYFSERLTSCFAAMTVPVYCGIREIGKFFNADGIIMIRPGDDPKKVLSQCSERDYEARIPAIVDNYRRTLDYMNIWDWTYGHYLNG